jgi:hypothetical protein
MGKLEASGARRQGRVFFVQGELRRGKADRDGKVGSMRV